MKSIKDLREDYNLITEKEEHDMNKLTQLVRAGLFDAKKLSALKRAMDKPADKMTAQEKRMMINLLDSLMSEVLSDKQVYSKIKRDVMKEAKSWETKDYLSKNDPRFGRGFPDQKDMPSVLLLKRKGIRVFPDGQKIGLYYAQAIDRYVSIPFQDINVGSHSVNEETRLDERGLGDIVGGIADFLSGGDNEESKKKEPKYLKPGEAGKTKLNVGGPKEKERDDDRPDATRSRMTSLNRDFMNAQAKSARNVRESFIGKLEVLREAQAKKEIWDDDMPEFPRVHSLSGVNIGGPNREKGSEAGFGGRKLSIASGSLRRNQSLVKRTRDRVKDVQQQVKHTKDVEFAKNTWKKIEAGKTKTKPSVVPRRKDPSETPPDRRRKDTPSSPSPRGPGRYEPRPRREPKKPVEPKKPEPTKPVEPKKPEPTKPVEPKPTKPDTKPVKPEITPVSPERREPDVKPGSKPNGKPESKPDAKPGSKPDAAPTHEPASRPREEPKPGSKPNGKPSSRGPRRPFFLPGLSLAGVQGKPLTPGPTKISLNVSAPKREGDPSAVASRMSSLERDMLKAQSKIRESVDLDGNLFELNSKAAKKVTALYESLNTKNKKKMVEAMNESAESLEKVISFAVRQ